MKTPIEVVSDYFTMMDAGDPAWLDLLDRNVEFWFPKFGAAVGRDGVQAFVEVLGQTVASLQHDRDTFRYHNAGSVVVVEGTERGTLCDGRAWPDGVISTGRFCNVFELQQGLITRLAIYLDPDFGSEDRSRVEALAPPSVQDKLS
jgi:ketosteroid isomerase-like protein